MIDEVLDARHRPVEGRDRAAHGLLAVHVAAADADALRELLEGAALGVGVIAVDRLERIEPLLEAIARGVVAAERAHRVCERHHRTLAADDAA